MQVNSFNVNVRCCFQEQPVLSRQAYFESNTKFWSEISTSVVIINRSTLESCFLELSRALIFCQFHTGVAYKSVTCKKARNIFKFFLNTDRQIYLAMLGVRLSVYSIVNIFIKQRTTFIKFYQEFGSFGSDHFLTILLMSTIKTQISSLFLQNVVALQINTSDAFHFYISQEVFHKCLCCFCFNSSG